MSVRQNYFLKNETHKALLVMNQYVRTFRRFFVRVKGGRGFQDNLIFQRSTFYLLSEEGDLSYDLWGDNLMFKETTLMIFISLIIFLFLVTWIFISERPFFIKKTRFIPFYPGFSIISFISLIDKEIILLA